ncbi:MAG TPA: DUF4388 domain-containing protein [Thermoanaerobaculia bacterium]|nr:DUF4388 domain-containing protein [Thermoanaerobaculia bacterium]
MDDAQQPLDPDVREALIELQRYLSDSLAPLMVAESVNLLLDYPAALAANEIQAWVVAQFRGRGQNIPIADFLYHAVEKIHAMGQYDLVPRDPLRRYTDDLIQRLLAFCPPVDRDILRQNLSRLGQVEGTLAAPVEMLRRQGGTAGEAATRRSVSGENALPLSPGTVSDLKHLSMLLERLGPLGMGGPLPPGARSGAEAAPFPAAAGSSQPAPHESAPFAALVQSPREALVAQILAVSAMAARSEGELNSALERLRAAGVDVPSGEVIRTLGRSIPPWPLSLPAEPVEQALAAARSSATAAIRRVVTLPHDQEEVGKRFQEMVSAAVEQLNQGSLTRASRMFDVAEKLVVENKVSPLSLDSTRRKAQDSVDLERVRSLGEDERNQQPLARILSFFPGLSVGALIEELRVEEKRERRRLLLSLLEVYGPEARTASLEILSKLAAAGAPEQDWHFKRNLLYLLRKTARAPEAPPDSELSALVPFADPSLPPPLVKEAIAGLAAIRHERSEGALASLVQGLETMLAKKGDAPFDEAELQPLLDRAVSALARFGSSTSRRIVVEHGLKRKAGLGDAGARLAELATQDLTEDAELLAVLVKAAKAEMPFKVFGLTLKKREDRLTPIVEALSGTPAPVVRKLFEEIVERHGDAPAAKAAAKGLAAFDAPKETDQTPASLMGDLAIFELPALLQSLASTEVTGSLALRDTTGAVVGKFVLENGLIRSAETGILRGDDACYQLFERPTGGTFSFVRQTSLPPARAGEELREVVSILLEGMRRYDDFQRFSALVPDDIVLVPTDRKPSTEPEEKDGALQKAVWTKASGGVAARAIEATVAADAYRVRRLLVRWVEEGSLKAA